MKRALGKTGWAALLLLPVAFLAWAFSLGYAAEQTFDGDATTVTIRPNTRYIISSIVQGGRDTTVVTVAGNGAKLVLYGNLSSIPAGNAILAAHLKVVATKAHTYGLGLYRLTAVSDSTAVSWRKRTSAINWSRVGASHYITNFDGSAAYGDTMFGASFDRLQFPSGSTFDGNVGVGETMTFDVTHDVQMAWSNGFVPQWILGASVEDTATANGGQVGAGSNATVGNRPSLVVTYGPVNPAGGGGGAAVGRNGRGIN